MDCLAKGGQHTTSQSRGLGDLHGSLRTCVLSDHSPFWSASPPALCPLTSWRVLPPERRRQWVAWARSEGQGSRPRVASPFLCPPKWPCWFSGLRICLFQGHSSVGVPATAHCRGLCVGPGRGVSCRVRWHPLVPHLGAPLMEDSSCDAEGAAGRAVPCYSC